MNSRPADWAGWRRSVKAKLDIRIVAESRGHEIRREGTATKMRCTFHKPDVHPSLSLTATGYRCFTCEEHGDIFDFFEKVEGLTRKEALGEAARLAQIPLQGNRRTEEGGGSIPPENDSQRRNGAPSDLTLEAYAEAKRLGVPFLEGLGLSTVTYRGKAAVRIPYLNEAREVVSTRFRLSLEKGDGARFVWKSGDKPCLYGLWRLDSARQAGYSVIVEGESDSHTLWHCGVPAIGVPGASNFNPERDAPKVADIPLLYVVVEPDTGGDTLLTRLTQALSISERLHLIELSDAKDVSELYLADPDLFRDRFSAEREKAVPWMQIARAQRSAEAKTAHAQASALLRDPRLLDCVKDAIQRGGYAGELGPPLLIYLAGTSRLLNRPVNMSVVAPSAAGKNRTVDAGLALLPPEAIYRMDAGSERALIYAQEDFCHRVVLVAEADSIPDEGPAASAVRSIAEDNVMRYDVVERDESTGRYTTRRIEKPGPTCLITTSTRSVRHQMGTRVLEVSISDTEEQTQLVLMAEAREVSSAGTVSVDLTPFHALQRYLELTGPHEVVISFAERLAGLMPAGAVRMRRDFRKLLAAIQAHALLHIEQRSRDSAGRILATLEDYAAVRELLAPVFEACLSEGVTPVIRQTVQAVPEEGEISLCGLATKLGVSNSTVGWRVNRAIKGGWLMNNESRPRHRARIARGDPLPEKREVLPIEEELQGCDVASDSPEINTPPPLSQASPAAAGNGKPDQWADENDVQIAWHAS